ncbi:IMPACT family protein [Devosia submarina]|uniref:IMPACT family protein n=1 Tax=Devosia submarina TaxID=1173082 RepID=UPI000D39E81E|nr:YigZ family protein [Devosia submarina]
MSQLYSLIDTAEARQEVKKSRFVAFAGAVEDEEAAKAFLAEHVDPSASHNCWAWRIGQSYRFSDDGEPSGTAGKPILQAIDGHGLDRIIVVVTRWFGGVLLGSGGLVRAYGGTAAMALSSAQKRELVAMASGRLGCSFGDLAVLQSRIGSISGVTLHSPEFHETGSRWSITMPMSKVETIGDLIRDLTGGRAYLELDD